MYKMFSVILILISTASSLQPEISSVDCTEEIATIDWINHYQDDLNTIWGYCVHHYCNTADDVIINETVSTKLRNLLDSYELRWYEMFTVLNINFAQWFMHIVQ